MAEINISSFAGGANNFLASDRLGDKYARLLRDLSIDNGALVSLHNDTAVNAASPPDLGHYGEANRSTAKQFGRWYWSINDAKAPPFYGGSDMGLGLTPPVHPPIVTAEKAEGVKLKGSYRYCSTCVINGYESAPGPVGDGYYSTVELAEGEYAKVQLPETPDGVQQVKLYRTAAEGADFYLVKVFTASEALTAHEDKLADLDLLFCEPMESLYYLPPPDGGKYLTECGSTFFLAVEDKLYFSEIGNCQAWNPSNWISFDDTITGICVEFQGLLVFTANRVYRVTGNDALTIAKLEIPTRQGCANWRTIATLSNAPLWMSNDGICMWDGQSVKLLSFQRWKLDSPPVFGFAANDRYYLVSETGTAVYDLRAGGVFYEISLDADYAWYDVDLDLAYYRRNGQYYELERGKWRRTGVYRSGLLGGNLALTEFRKLRVSSDCSVEYVLRDHLGREIDSGTIYNADTAEQWLKTGHPTRGCDIELRFDGTLREFSLTGWQMKN